MEQHLVIQVYIVEDPFGLYCYHAPYLYSALPRKAQPFGKRAGCNHDTVLVQAQCALYSYSYSTLAHR
jgi:hypothetical protein